MRDAACVLRGVSALDTAGRELSSLPGEGLLDPYVDLGRPSHQPSDGIERQGHVEDCDAVLLGVDPPASLPGNADDPTCLHVPSAYSHNVMGKA
jgi:hypothetical protein